MEQSLDAKGGVYASDPHMLTLQLFLAVAREEKEGVHHYEELKGTVRYPHPSLLFHHFRLTFLTVQGQLVVSGTMCEERVSKWLIPPSVLAVTCRE